MFLLSLRNPQNFFLFLHRFRSSIHLFFDVLRIHRYDEAGLKKHFETWIKTPLLLVTRDKSESYEVYIERMLPNAAACMVKFADLASNINFTGLDVLGEKELDRLCRYARYAKTINDKWHFLENVQKYLRYRSIPLEKRSYAEQEAFWDWSFDWEE